jgi:CRP-like cAMP-binding protein
MEIANFLRTVPLFTKLDDAELQRFAELTREKSYPKGSVILFEDDPGDSLFIVRDGRVKVVLVGEDGREVILGVLGSSEHFGELSLIDEQPRSAHVIAMEDTNVLVLRSDDFRRRVEANPAVAWVLMQELSRRLRRADGKIQGWRCWTFRVGSPPAARLRVGRQRRPDREAAHAPDDRAHDRRKPRDRVSHHARLPEPGLDQRGAASHRARRSACTEALRTGPGISTTVTGHQPSAISGWMLVADC